VNESTLTTPSLRAWWLALAAFAVCGPWPGWRPSAWALLVVTVGLLFLARPRGTDRWAWVAVAGAVATAMWTPPASLSPKRLESRLDRHCVDMLTTAQRTVEEPTIRRVFEAGGEALDPSITFKILEGRVGGVPRRTVYLADDRGRVVAWGGDTRAFPRQVRPLGDRRWGVVWSAASAVLFVREPLLVDGRLVGAVTVADWSPLEAKRVWGMIAPLGTRFWLGRNHPSAIVVRVAASPGVEVPVGYRNVYGLPGAGLEWLTWLGFAVVALWRCPKVAWAVVAVGGGALAFAPGGASAAGLAVMILLAAAAIGRICRILSAAGARTVVMASLLAAGLVAVFGPLDKAMTWLPDRLLVPGWGGIWMVAVAWVAAGWPLPGGQLSPSLTRRMGVACGLAALGMMLEMARLPVMLSRVEDAGSKIALPRGDITLAAELPESADRCLVYDLAPVLANRWHLEDWRTPSELRLVGGDGTELSRWGDLSVAGENVRPMLGWSVHDLPETALELYVATPPWSLLGDWRSGATRDSVRSGPAWFAVLTRSGSVAATLHPEIRDLDPAAAGELYHNGGGWTRLRVGDRSRLARVWRKDDWLVAAVARYPEEAVWVLRTAMASLWGLLGLLLAAPPTLKSQQLGTFGGRLRMLVAGGVVVPLVILTVFLNLRLRQEEARLERVLGLDALEAARYTVVHLSGAFEVDDELARWLSAGWGGEVILFDGAEAAAVSRRDLMDSSVLPQLPDKTVFPSFLVGREEPIVRRERERVVAAGAVELQGRRLLLELIRHDPLRIREVSRAVDWLLTGALLAALLALVLTSRIESRLSASLRDLVLLARRLLHGEPLGEVRRPAETDLAEVIDAVRTMNQHVQQRELSLRHQEELLRITLATLAQAVVVLEANGDLRFSNSSADHLREEHGDLMLEVVRGRLRDGSPSEEPTVDTIQPFPGRDLTWRVGVAGVPLPDGSRGVVAVIEDVTDVVRVDRLRQLNQLARIVAHEVKNPLTPIRLWMQELDEARQRKDPRLGQLLEEACGEISVQVERLQDTANSFSNLVALERWEPDQVDLVELVSDTLDGTKILARRGIRLIPELPRIGCCFVTGDRRWLQRALDNLIKNSVDALGDRDGEVHVRVTCDDDHTVLEVEDTAGGIPDVTLQDLFSPHFSTTTSGSGLGLALVHQVVVRCQGRVAAENGDLGLVVRLEFPDTMRP